MAEIVGRDDELAAVDRFLARPRPAALLIEGEAGIGKTILWREGIQRAGTRDRRVLSASPAEAETQLPFAALGDLLTGAFNTVADKLPSPQRRALGAALLLDEAEDRALDRHLVAVAALTAFRLLAATETLVLAIDDVQWLDADSQKALEFVFRRFGDLEVSLLMVRRVQRDERLPLGLDRATIPVERVRIGGLSLGAIGALARLHTGVSFRRPMLHRIHKTSGGNPLFALGLADGLVRAGEEQAGPELPFPGSLEEVVHDRIRLLPAATNEALLFAAALSDPTRSVLEQVVGSDLVDRLVPAVDAAVVELRADAVRFTHPLLRSAVYHGASQPRRMRLHRRLSELELPLEERALHLALVATAPDDTTASVLEEAAGVAARRGATAAAAALAGHAVRLSDPNAAEAIRRRRYLAAGACWASGDVDRARTELEAIIEAAPPGPIRGQALLRLATYPGDPLKNRQLCEEALQHTEQNLALRSDVLLFLADWEFSAHAGGDGDGLLAQAIEAATAIGDDVRRTRAEISRAFWDWVRGRAFDRAVLDRAAEVDACLATQHPSLEERALYARAIVLTGTLEIASARDAWLDLERIAVDTGDDTLRAEVLSALARLEYAAGNWQKGAEYSRAAIELAEQTGPALASALVDAALHAALGGEVELARDCAARCLDLVGRARDPWAAARVRWVVAFLALSLGDAAEAARQIGQALGVAYDMGFWGIGERFLPVGVEAALGLGDIARADKLTCRLEELAGEAGIDSYRVDALRCRALVAAARHGLDGALASAHQAATMAGRLPVPFNHGWTLLALGAIQRRARQRRAARETLQAALAIFESLAAPLWAERARNEIARIGGRAASPNELTPTEERVACLVAEGKTNKEVAAELVVTVRAVEANLSRIYAKLNVRSRAELARRYRAGEQA
jgi:DNA-binding CsgD family transcriptional regulator